MEATLKGLKMVMYELKEMPERIYNKETKVWDSTGKTEQRYYYTFRDILGKTINFYGPEDLKSLEGKDCDVQVVLEQREFQGNKTIRVKMATCYPMQ